MLLDRYVGIPFEPRGRTFSGCDCWGLVVLVFRHELGVELPSYCERYSTDADRRDLEALIAGEKGAWREVRGGEERPFDCALLVQERFASHVGVVVSKAGCVLHAKRGVGSVVEPYRSSFRRLRVAGFYRHDAATCPVSHRG